MARPSPLRAIAALIIADERRTRFWVAAALTVVALSASVTVRPLWAVQAHPHLASQACESIYRELPEDERKATELPEEFGVVPEVDVHWNGDVTCRWTSGFGPEQAVGESAYTVTLWEFFGARFAVTSL